MLELMCSNNIVEQNIWYVKIIINNILLGHSNKVRHPYYLIDYYYIKKLIIIKIDDR